MMRHFQIPNLHMLERLVVSIFLIFTLCCLGCIDRTVVEGPKARGEVYFPLIPGSVWIYKVDSIVYDDFRNTIDTHAYQVKIELADSVDEGGIWAMRAWRSIRKDEADPWTYLEDILFYRDDYRAVVKQNNVRDIKLAFPIALYKSWDGNLLNTLEPAWYEILTLHEPLQVGSTLHQSTLQVLRRDVFNALQRSYSLEIYEKDVGLLQSECIETQSQSIGQIIPKGYACAYRLISYAHP